MTRAGIFVLIVALAFLCSYAVAVAQGETEAAPAPTAASSSESTESSDSGTAVDTPPDDYRIQPEDVIRVTVLGEPELAVEQIVDPKGEINLSLVGPIQAAGLTRQELTDRIVQGLSKYLVEPQVQLTLSRFRLPKVYVMGFVNRPGAVELKPGDRVMEAIAQAGSFNPQAYLEGATITHKGSKEQVSVNLRKLFYENDLSQNVSLEDGDTIYIPEDVDNRYFVIGEVFRPGKYTLKEKVSVVDAISEAGGVTDRANPKVTYIIRGDPKKPQRIRVDVSKFLKSADMSQNVVLQPGDVVYVPESSKPDWNKIAGIISVIVNTSYLTRIWGL